MPKAMMGSTAQIVDTVGGQSVVGASPFEVNMDTELVCADSRFIEVSLANNALVLKQVGWYLGWGGVFVHYTGATIGYVSFAAQLYLDDVALPNCVGDVGRITYDIANSHVQVHNTSSMSPTPFYNDTANQELNLRCVRVDHFNLPATAVTATSNPGRSFLAAQFLTSATE